jgi:signal peptidase
MKKILSVIMSIVSAILITIGVAALVLFIIPSIAGYKPFIVQSGSMEPEIKTGAVAYNNTHAKLEEVKVGDVIVFKTKDTHVTHRVIKINNDGTFTTKGDANETEDLAPVKFEQYKGKTAFTIPYLGYVLKYVQNKKAVFILVTAVGLNLVYAVFSSEDKKEEKEKNKKKKDKEKEPNEKGGSKDE